MWICTTKGLVSIVQSKVMPEVLVVRARAKKTLAALFPNYKDYIRTMGSDYPYRIFVTRELVAKTIAEEVLAINYDNFKSAVSSLGDKKYLSFLTRTWFEGCLLEDENARRRFQETNTRTQEFTKDAPKPLKKPRWFG